VIEEKKKVDTESIQDEEVVDDAQLEDALSQPQPEVQQPQPEVQQPQPEVEQP
jgi:hypothetical protein